MVCVTGRLVHTALTDHQKHAPSHGAVSHCMACVEWVWELQVTCNGTSLNEVQNKPACPLSKWNLSDHKEMKDPALPSPLRWDHLSNEKIKPRLQETMFRVNDSQVTRIPANDAFVVGGDESMSRPVWLAYSQEKGSIPCKTLKTESLSALTTSWRAIKNTWAGWCRLLPGTWETEEAGDLWEFEASLSYILSSRAAIAVCRAILLLCTCT